jgi:hypothetical protein
MVLLASQYFFDYRSWTLNQGTPIFDYLIASFVWRLLSKMILNLYKGKYYICRYFCNKIQFIEN